MSIYQWLCLIGVQGAVVAILTIVINKTTHKIEKNAEDNRRETGAIKDGVKALLKDNPQLAEEIEGKIREKLKDVKD